MIEFSLTLPRFHDPGERQPYRRTYDFCRTVDRLGYAGGFIGHHSFSPEVMDEAGIGAQTERMRLGTGVYLAGLHHPANIVEQVSTLDRITNGRAVLGVGTGYREYEFKAFGTDYTRRGKRLDETLAVCRKAWATGSYAWDGEFFHFDDIPVFPPAVQTPNPPIYVGGTSPAALRRAARYGDSWFTLPMETLSVVQGLVAQYRAACTAEGRTPRICLMRKAWVGETDAEVETEWYPRALSFHRYYWDAGTKGDHEDPILQRVAAGEDPPYQEFVRNRAFAGTPDLVIDEIRRWHEAIGFDECCLIFATGREATTQAALTRAVTLFAEEVAPAFA